MQIAVSILPDEYASLASHVPEDSSAHHALSTAAVLSRMDGDGISQTYEVICGNLEAHALLSVAQRFCPSAARKIAAAMRQ